MNKHGLFGAPFRGWGIPKLGETKLYNYGYDQLNRLLRMDTWNGYNAVAGDWEDMAKTDEYQERISYDGNGNILTYLRKGNATEFDMDDLTYGYNKDGNDHLSNNRLRHVKDAIGDDNYTVDIDDQDDDNYAYDAIGNLIKDTLQHPRTFHNKASGYPAVDGQVRGRMENSWESLKRTRKVKNGKENYRQIFFISLGFL